MFLDKRANGIVQPDGSLGTENHTDFYINIPITRTYKKFDDYIQVEKDPFRTLIDRPKINPYFIEFGFFETIKTIKDNGHPEENIEQKSKNFNITINK